MSRRRHLVAALAVVAMALGLLPAGAAAQPRPLVTGVTNLGTNAPLAFARVHDAGARFVRVPLYWAGTALGGKPANPSDPDDPSYNWSEANEAVRNAYAAGLTPLMLFDGAPSWAQRCQSPPSLSGAVCDPDPIALREFATAAAKHFSGRVSGVPAVTYFQALNEPNLSLWFFPQFETSGKELSPGLYRTVVNAFYEGIKSVDRNDVVVAAGLGPIAVPKLTIGPLKFARQLLCMRGIKNPKPAAGCGGPVHFDIFAIQPYTTGGPTHEGGPNDVELADLPKLQKLLAAADRAGHIAGMYKRTPLWVTEFSWDSKPPDPGGLPMKIEVRWVAEALHVAWSAGVDHFFWFSLRDEAREGRPTSEALESGLYFRGSSLAADKAKPILAAFRFPFVAYPGKQLEFWGRTPTSTPGKVRIQAKLQSGWKTVATVTAKETGIFQGRKRTSYGANLKGAVRAVVGGQKSPAFGMKPVPDFVHPPFG